jgi:uncharacterized protein (TIGR02145 family)
VGLPDLLILLTGYNSCGTSDAEGLFGCGDPVSYQGYDYTTVLIGEQCWFAENLRSASYRNDEPIGAGLDNATWSTTTDGAQTVYGEGDGSCSSQAPDVDACDEVASLATYGRLYNAYAVADERGLCPSGWHVPSDQEWMELEMHLGMTEEEVQDVALRGTDQGTQLKSVEGWSEDGGGTNATGFLGLPHGYRYVTGTFFFAGTLNFWWTSSLHDETKSWYRALLNSSPKVSRNHSDRHNGYAVRCTLDVN